MMKITLSLAIEGYELAAYARKLSPQTLSDYRNSFGKFGAWLGKDQELEEISADDIRAFLVSQNGIAAKTLPNFHPALFALWRWANRERIVEGNIDRDIIPPKPDQTAIWRHLCTRDDSTKAPGRPLFTTCEDRRITRDNLYHTIQRVGERVGIAGANVHGFRHTCAIHYLRNGGTRTRCR
ncbi:MAG: site-specific integrase [Marinobacter sp.]|uniref:site-specific integrase n=1 Tax=Marinobacter sp. TaxID=50741 RepID=UPI00396D1917